MQPCPCVCARHVTAFAGDYRDYRTARMHTHTSVSVSTLRCHTRCRLVRLDTDAYPSPPPSLWTRYPSLPSPSGFRQYTEVYARDEKQFFHDFAWAYAKLISLGCPPHCDPTHQDAPGSEKNRLSAEFRDLAMHGAVRDACSSLCFLLVLLVFACELHAACSLLHAVSVPRPSGGTARGARCGARVLAARERRSIGSLVFAYLGGC